MSSFSLEIAAHALIPKELLSEASSLHFAVHLSTTYVEASLAECAGGELHWSRSFRPESAHQSVEEMLAFINERNWSERVFRRCTISYDVTKFCMVPFAFFSQENCRSMLEFNCGQLDNEVAYIEMRELDAVLIHEVPSWTQGLQSKFPNARFLPSSFLFLKHSAMIAERDGQSLMIYRDGNMMMLAAFKNRKLQLFNAYPIQNEEDILYYASNAAMRLNIDFEHVALHVYSHTKDNSLYGLLKHYNRSTFQVYPEAGSTSQEASFISHLHVLCA